MSTDNEEVRMVETDGYCTKCEKYVEVPAGRMTLFLATNFKNVGTDRPSLYFPCECGEKAYIAKSSMLGLKEAP